MSGRFPWKFHERSFLVPLRCTAVLPAFREKSAAVWPPSIMISAGENRVAADDYREIVLVCFHELRVAG